MSYFAKIENGIVTNVIVSDNIFAEILDENSPAIFVPTPSEYDSIITNASIGGTYDAVKKVFISQKPYPSWILNESNFQWEAPVPKPDDGLYYYWDENNLTWVLWHQ